MVTAPTSYEGRLEVKCTKIRNLNAKKWWSLIGMLFNTMQKLKRMFRNEELFYLVSAECNCDSIHNILDRVSLLNAVNYSRALSVFTIGMNSLE